MTETSPTQAFALSKIASIEAVEDDIISYADALKAAKKIASEALANPTDNTWAMRAALQTAAHWLDNYAEHAEKACITEEAGECVCGLSELRAEIQNALDGRQ